jgi:hypothetical protein
MKKNNRSLPDARTPAETLIAEAQAARVKEHVRAVLARLQSRNSQSLRKAA